MGEIYYLQGGWDMIVGDRANDRGKVGMGMMGDGDFYSWCGDELA